MLFVQVQELLFKDIACHLPAALGYGKPHHQMLNISKKCCTCLNEMLNVSKNVDCICN